MKPIELFAANPQGDPCATDTGGGINADISVAVPKANPLVEVRAELLFSHTEADGKQQAVAESGVAHLTLVALGHLIEVEVLTAEAQGGPCPSTGLSADSTVLSVRVDKLAIKIPKGPHGQDHLDIPILGLGTLHLNHQFSTANTIGRRALWLETSLIGDVIVTEAIADVHGNPCGRPPRPHGFSGWMTGGGKVTDDTGTVIPGFDVTHGFRLECNKNDGPNNLQVNWDGGHFHLEGVSSASCSDTAGIDPGNPLFDRDTLVGSGSGRCNGGAASATWKMTDAGEPGDGDYFQINISGSCSLAVSGSLANGNLAPAATTRCTSVADKQPGGPGGGSPAERSGAGLAAALPRRRGTVR